MNTLEKLAYLKGLVEGLALDETKKDTKVIYNLISLLEDVVQSVAELQSDCSEMKLQLDEVDKDLGSIEEELYDDAADTCSCGEKKAERADEIYYEVTCPTCGDTIHLDEDIISQSEIDCPNCGEKLEFDLD